MKEEKRSVGGGIGFCGLLTIVFIVLKLCKIISWSWVWVLAPTWIPAALVILFILCVILGGTKR
nr:MAG TPA: transmembrane protein [Caudoviricetes sp.]